MSLMTQSFKEIAEHVLPGITRMTQSSSALLYINDSRLIAPRFFQYGDQPGIVTELEKLCAEQFNQISDQSDWQPVMLSASPVWKITADLTLYPLQAKDRCVGLIGLTTDKGKLLSSSNLLERLLRSLSNIISRLADHEKSERQISHLNAYLTVSSMLAQSMDLHELLELTLYSCMDVVSAEAASVLLLDDEKKNFRFYHVEGPAKPVLETATFPADQGLAGSVLRTQESEVINDVRNDPRFYEKIDLESGFQTRNMIAIPLIAGKENVGVLEVLNKVYEGSFTEEERLLLLSFSEEIAFAIRNAKVFDYVVNSYCKQRQGQLSCKGCKRPLGSWTPCVKYREASI